MNSAVSTASSGLITISDLIEAIVGEIDDEYDFDIDPQLIERPDGSAIADGRYPIKNLRSQHTATCLPRTKPKDANVDTLGGLITRAIAGHVPSRGEIIRHASGIEFEVLDADLAEGDAGEGGGICRKKEG